MKILLQFILFFVCFNAKAQIELEHAYDSAYVYRFLNNQGKDQYIKRSGKTSYIYNSDHTLRRVIQHPFAPSNDFFTENLKNDTLMDFVYRTYLPNDMATLSILNEKGDTMLPAFNTYNHTSFQYIHIKDNDKIFEQFAVRGQESASTKVIDVKTAKRQDRVNFGGGFLKYKELEFAGDVFFHAGVDGNFSIYNTKQELIRKMPLLDLPANTIYYHESQPSQAIFDSDNMIEVLYNYVVRHPTLTYLPMFHIAKENGTILFPKTEGRAAIYGKHLVYFNTDFIGPKYIYSIPEFQLEKTISTDWTFFSVRGKVTDKLVLIKDNNVEIYTDKLVLLKKFNLPLISEKFRDVLSVSEDLLVADEKLEFIYGTFNNDGVRSIVIVNEDSKELLRIPYCEQVSISTLPNTRNKLIASQNTYFGNDIGVRTLIYGLSSITKLEERIEPKKDALVYPNPFSDYIQIHLDNEAQIDCTIRMYDITGKVVYRQKDFAKIIQINNLQKLPSGLYFLDIQTDKGHVLKKIVKQ